MAQQAREITAADLARRVPRRGAEDELDYLADTLNVTLARRIHTEVELAIEVADTGVGLAREKQDEIFQAFTQGDSSTTRRSDQA